VSSPLKDRIRGAACVAVLLLSLFAPSCRRGQDKVREVAYVSALQVNLRDRVSALYNKTGTLKNGERVEVLARNRRFARVRSASGETGWVQQRFLVGEAVYRGLERLAADNRNLPVQAHGLARATLRMHIMPGRDADSLIQLQEGDKLEILKRAIAEKPQRAPAPATPAAPKASMDVPLDVAQYAEGRRIVAYFILNTVHDNQAPASGDENATPAPRDVPQYLVLFAEPKDGMPWDYDEARIFTWNLKRHRYETAYRERKLFGIFPVMSGTQDFGKGGAEPVFTLRVKDADGNVHEKKYRMSGNIVRRVITPEEQAAEKAARTAKTKAR
jgi:hypothetical protein